MAVSEGALEVDLYGGSFVRVRPTVPLERDRETWLKPELAAAPGPGGAVIADLAALRGFGHTATWYDTGGALGKMTTSSGNDVWPSDLATWIEHGQVMAVRDVAPGSDGHPHLIYVTSEAETPPPDAEPPVPAHPVYASRADLAEAAGEPTGEPGRRRLEAALILASRWVDHYVGYNVADRTAPISALPMVDPWTIEVVAVDPRARAGALVQAIRFLRSPDVPFGVAGGLGDLAVYVRASNPEAELQLRGMRESWGIA